MNTSSIRFRLAAWYFVVLTLTLLLFGGGTWLAMRASIDGAADEELAVRRGAIAHYIERKITGLPPEHVRETLEELAGLQLGRSLLQISSEGDVLYRSPIMEELEFPSAMALSENQRTTREGSYETVRSPKHTYRVITAVVTAKNQPYRIQIAARLDDFYEALDGFGWTLLGSLPIALILASVGGYWMSRRALAPVDEITQAAREVSPGNLSKGLAVPKTADELQRLSETLNEMMQRLDTAFKRVAEFTADASHELRTPIAVMRTTSELALRKPRSAEEYRDALTCIHAELERTSGLIENLMTLARADSGAEALLIDDIDLAISVREACAQGRPLAELKQVVLETSFPEQVVPVRGDAQAIRRLFLILIDNAVKYTPAGGRVDVSVRAVNGYAVGEVRDSGIGIASDDLPKVFDRFYRADKVRTRSQGGTGLGLSIAHWIVRAHQGDVLVNSTLGSGSSFQVRLPTAKT